MEEREHLVRVAAAVLASPTAIAPLHATNTLALLASFLPAPRVDASGAVTALSVVQPPLEPMNPKLIGNAVKCFVVVMDDPSSAPAQRLTAAGLLERLVAALANVSELAVRKNVAVVLARAMRHEPHKARVRELRGIEMLVQLGPVL